MSALAASGPRSIRPGPRWISTIACVTLLAACVAGVAREIEGRRRLVSVVREQGLERRQPAVVETVNLIEGNDEAALLVAEALAGEPSGAEAAQELVFGGLARRPGSAYALLLLGRSAPLEGRARWARPLELAVAAAPGLEIASSELASRYLALWPSLAPPERKKGEEAFRRAFQSPSFLSASFKSAVAVLGPETAVKTLPDDPETLRLAALVAGDSGPATDAIAARLKVATPAP